MVSFQLMNGNFYLINSRLSWTFIIEILAFIHWHPTIHLLGFDYSFTGKPYFWKLYYYKHSYMLFLMDRNFFIHHKHINKHKYARDTRIYNKLIFLPIIKQCYLVKPFIYWCHYPTSLYRTKFYPKFFVRGTVDVHFGVVLK